MGQVGGRLDEEEEEIPAGEVIAGQYVIERKLGSGGMGAVYRARQMNLGRVVALKLLKGQVSGGLSERARFAREARLMTRLRHPNLLTVFDAEVTAEPRYIAMELVTGCALLDLLEAAGRAQALDPLTMAIGLADALAYIHGEGVLHRDLKPANVLLRDGRHALLADFGLAREHGASALTTDGFVVGTPAYLAPEQIEQGGASVQSDLYQLGLVLYELFAGQLVFGTLQAGAGQMLALRLSGRIPELAKAAPQCDPRVTAVVMRCVDRRPERRFSDARSLLAALRPLAPPSRPLPIAGPAARQESPSAGAAPGPRRTARVEAAGPPRPRVGHARPASRRRVVALAAVLLGLTGLAGVAWLSRGAGGDQPDATKPTETAPRLLETRWSYDPSRAVLKAILRLEPAGNCGFRLAAGQGPLTTSAEVAGPAFALPFAAGDTFAVESTLRGAGAPVRLTQTDLTAHLAEVGTRLEGLLSRFWSRTKLTDQALVDRLRGMIGMRGLTASAREAASTKVRTWLAGQGILDPVVSFLDLSPLYFDTEAVPIAARIALYKVLSPLEVADATCAAYGLPSPFGRAIADHTGITFRQEQEPDLTGWESYSFQEPEGDGMIGFTGPLDVPSSFAGSRALVGAHLHFDSTGILKVVINGLPIYFSKRPAKQYVKHYRLGVVRTSGRAGIAAPSQHVYDREKVALLSHAVPPHTFRKRPMLFSTTAIWIVPQLFLERNAARMIWVSCLRAKRSGKTQ